MSDFQAILMAHREDPTDVDKIDAFLRAIHTHIINEPNYHFHTLSLPESIALFSLDIQNLLIAPSLLKISLSLNTCVECVVAFHRCTESFLERLKVDHAHVYQIINARLVEWNRGRMEDLMESLKRDFAMNGGQVESKLRSSAIPLIFDLISHPKPLQDPHIYQLFEQVLVLCQRKRKLTLRMEGAVYDGCILLSFSEIEGIREWARGCVRNGIVGSDLKWILQVVVERAQTDRCDMQEIWSSLIELIRIVPRGCTSLDVTGLDRLVVGLIGRAKGDFYPTMKWLTMLLVQCECVWIKTLFNEQDGLKLFTFVFSSFEFEELSASFNEGSLVHVKYIFTWMLSLSKHTTRLNWLKESIKSLLNHKFGNPSIFLELARVGRQDRLLDLDDIILEYCIKYSIGMNSDLNVIASRVLMRDISYLKSGSYQNDFVRVNQVIWRNLGHFEYSQDVVTKFGSLSLCGYFNISNISSTASTNISSNTSTKTSNISSTAKTSSPSNLNDNGLVDKLNYNQDLEVVVKYGCEYFLHHLSVVQEWRKLFLFLFFNSVEMQQMSEKELLKLTIQGDLTGLLRQIEVIKELEVVSVKVKDSHVIDKNVNLNLVLKVIELFGLVERVTQNTWLHLYMFCYSSLQLCSTLDSVEFGLLDIVEFGLDRVIEATILVMRVYVCFDIQGVGELYSNWCEETLLAIKPYLGGKVEEVSWLLVFEVVEVSKRYVKDSVLVGLLKSLNKLPNSTELKEKFNTLTNLVHKSLKSSDIDLIYSNLSSDKSLKSSKSDTIHSNLFSDKSSDIDIIHSNLFSDKSVKSSEIEIIHKSHIKMKKGLSVMQQMKLSQLQESKLLHSYTLNSYTNSNVNINQKRNRDLNTNSISKRLEEEEREEEEEESQREKRSAKLIKLSTVTKGVHLAKKSKKPFLLKMNSLYDFIISFNTKNTLKKDFQKSNTENEISNSNSRNSLKKEIIKIPNNFIDEFDYAKYFEATFFTELKAALEEAKLIGKPFISVNLENIKTVDNSFELEIALTTHQMDKEKWSENHILITQNDILIRVKEVKRKKDSITLLCHSKKSNLQVKTEIKLRMLMSITTQIREYRALSLINNCLLLPSILKPPIHFAKVKLNRVDHFMQKLKVNESQASAIDRAVALQSGFLLVQGPPGTQTLTKGTGKTKTILAMIVALLTAKAASIAIPTPGQSLSDRPDSKKRLLVVAPSNAAIDEIGRRLMAGVMADGALFTPKLLRIGIASSIHPDVYPVSLDAAKERLGKDTLEDLVLVKNLQEKKRILIEKEKGGLQVDKEIGKLTAAIKDAIIKEKLIRKERLLKAEKARNLAVKKLVLDTDILLCTLSGSGHDMISDISGLKFETVIIDEACQAVELSTLIPLRYGCRKCILVGDPKQLPPTVISTEAAKSGYDKSLFQRLMIACPDSIVLLNIQYRMHPDISEFPRLKFYGDALQDAHGMAAVRKIEWHSHDLFPPFTFYDVYGNEARNESRSLYNTEEVQLCLLLVKTLVREFKGLAFGHRIGIISFYKEQVKRIREAFGREFGKEVLDLVDVNTVDGFQGQEKDIIILSSVRSSQSGGVGFLSDERRLNVALSRARYSLIVLGDIRTLERDDLWKDLVRDAERRRCVSRLRITDFKIRTNENFDNLFKEAYAPVVKVEELE